LQFEERNHTVDVNILSAGCADNEIVRSYRDAQVPRRSIDEDVLDLELEPLVDEPLRKDSALLDASVRDVAMTALLDRTVDRSPSVVAWERELSIGRRQSKQRRRVTLVQPSHHRARKAMAAYDAERQVPTSGRQESTRKSLVQFLRALEQHDVGAIESLLAQDVRTTTDGGGQFRAALRTIAGREKVMRFYLAVAENAAQAKVRMPTLNGVPSVVVDIPSPLAGIAPRFTLTVELNRDGKIAHLYVVSATQKLSAIR
jgi:hypothetical protein